MKIEPIEIEQDNVFRQKFISMIDELVTAKKFRNISELAKKLKTRADVIKKIRDGERFPTVDQIRRLIKIGTNPGYLFEGSNILNNILHAGLRANAGDAVHNDIFCNFPTFGIPDIHGKLYSFYIQGDSMEPNLLDGDLVLCELISDQSKIIDNQVYVIILGTGAIRSKRLKLWREADRIQGLELHSDNSKYRIEYLNFDDLDSVKLFRVKKRITESGLYI